MIHVSKKEVMHRTVPITGKLVPGYAIPPVRVEASVGETGEFRKNVEL